MCPVRAQNLILYTFVLFRIGGWTTFSNKPRAAFVLTVLFAFLVLGAQAAEPPAKSVIQLGSFKLASSQAVLANNSSISNSSINNISINNSTMSKMPINNLSGNGKQMNSSAPAMPVIDLSGYARDLKNKNLTGYKNIMYPMGESRGPPGGVAGGGGGCGCGG